MCSLCKDRRQFVFGSLAFGFSLLAFPSLARAQFFPGAQYALLCSWSGGSNFGQGLAAATPDAIGQIQIIAQVIQYPVPLQVYIGGVPNASATIINNGPAIIYNPGFLNVLFACDQAAGMTVLAHEIGHHANLDTTWAGQYRHPWTRELGADWASGLAMKRLGISLYDTQSGIQCSMGPFSPGSPSHPDSQLRLQAVTQGWQMG
jgi:hypothetical protein